VHGSSKEVDKSGQRGADKEVFLITGSTNTIPVEVD
jgi:hypothetical protein